MPQVDAHTCQRPPVPGVSSAPGAAKNLPSATRVMFELASSVVMLCPRVRLPLIVWTKKSP